MKEIFWHKISVFSREEYRDEGNWLGNCTDPKSLYEKVVARPHDFLSYISITTFDGEVVEPAIDDDSFWKVIPFTYDKLDFVTSMVDLCYVLVIPERLQNQGIRSISAVTEPIGIKISPPGYFYLNYDIKEQPIYPDNWLDLILDYQINNFIKIGRDEPCIPDPSFNRDDCVFKQMLNVSTKPLCIIVSLGYKN